MAYSIAVEPGVRVNDPCWLSASLVGWVLSATNAWKLVGYRYEYEKKVIQAHGFDLFLEVEYAPLLLGKDFPCVEYAAYELPEWYMWWMDVVEYSHVKVISRLTLKEDMCVTSNEG